MNRNQVNPQEPHIVAQVVAASVAYDKQIRAEHLQESLQALNSAFSLAMQEMQKVRDFVGSPKSILGNAATKHGEIAEQVHVGVTRAFDALNGRMPSATFEGIGRLDAVDYQVNGTDIQSKYINGLRNTLDHILTHAERYPDFVRRNSRYHIPNDYYKNLKDLQSTGKIDGLSDKSIQSIQRKLESIQDVTGRDAKDLIQPGEASYAEVQQDKIHSTIENREQRLSNEKDELQNATIKEHSPSIQGFGQAAAFGAVAGAGVSITQGLWSKWQSGKNPFRGDLTVSDWQEIGIQGVHGAGGGVVAGGTLYLLTNATELAAPFAGAMVSSLMGIGRLLQQYHGGKINSTQCVELSLLVASDAAIIGLVTTASQTLIPIPILGAFIGSIAGKLVASALKDSLESSESQLLQQLAQYESTFFEKIDQEYYSILSQFDQYFGNLEQLLAFSFDEKNNTALRLEISVCVAEKCGVPKTQIIYSADEVDRFMLE